MSIKLPVKETAKLLGVTPGFISNINKGRKSLPVKYCLKVATHFGFELHDLRSDVYPKSLTIQSGNDS